MLYGLDRSDGGDRDYIPGLFGLGAIVPHTPPAVTTSGGGYRTQGSGSGGAPAAGETQHGGSQGASYRPVDRNTSIGKFRLQGKARNEFSKSGRGPRYAVGQSPLMNPSGLFGLDAITPSHGLFVTSGGGGIGPAGTGTGGGPGPTQTQVAPSVMATYRPKDQSVSMRTYRLAGRARLAFQKSGRGSKISPLTPGGPFGPSGLSGLGLFSSNVLTPGGASAVEYAVSPKRKSSLVLGGPRSFALPYHPSDDYLNGLGFGFGSISSFFQRATAPVRNVLPSPIRKAIRYSGVAATTIATGGFVPQPLMRKTFGLSPGESRISEIGLKTARGVTTAVALTAGAGAMGYGPFAGWNVPVTAAPLPPEPIMSALPSQTALGAKLSLIPPTGIMPAAPTFGSGVPIATSATFSGPALAPASSGFWTGVGGKLLSGTGEVLKTTATMVGTQALLDKLTPRPQATEAGQTIVPGSEQSVYPIAYPATTGAGQTPQGGASDGGEAPLSTSAIVTPVIGLGVAGLALYFLYGRGQ